MGAWRFKLGKLTVYITQLKSSTWIVSCKPILPDTRIEAKDLKAAQQNAFRLLREKLMDHVKMISGI